jgi:hypothetical protein
MKKECENKMIKSKLITGIIFLSMLILFGNSVLAATKTISLVDPEDDVLTSDSDNQFMLLELLVDPTLFDEEEYQDFEYVNRADADIIKVTCIQDGRNIETQLEIKNGGKIQNELDYTHLFYYMIIIYTTNGTYYLTFGFNELESKITSFVDKEEGTDQEILSEFELKDDNKISISFDLPETKEILVSVPTTFILEAEYSIGDALSEDSFGSIFADILFIDSELEPMSGGNYSSERGKKVQFNGDIDGDPSKYNWIWVIEDDGIILEGQNPTYSFNFEKEYHGTLYVHDSQGNFGEVPFKVDVSKSSSNGEDKDNTSEDTPGFEIIIFFTAIILLLFILKRRKFK